MTGQSWKYREEFHGFVIFQYIVHEKFPFKCWLVIEFVSNCLPLTIDKLFYHIIHLLEVNVCLAKNSQIFLFFESFFSINFVFLRAYSWSFRAISEETRKSFSGKYFFDFFASVSFSPLIRPFVALTWTSTNCMLIKYCWNRAVCSPFNSKKCLHDLFSLEA